jgi:hypothetical protein
LTSLACRQCGKPITFDSKHISQRTGKKIPLDVETNEPHDCPVRRDNLQPQRLERQIQQSYQQQERRYHQCIKGCGNEIYFDVNSKSQSGKWIPLDKDTGQPHQCQTNNNDIDVEEE